MEVYTCLEKYGQKYLFYTKIRLSQFFGNKYLGKRLVGGNKSEIVAISNKYKDTLDNFIDNSDTESLD